MHKLIFITLFLCSALGHAKVLDAIALVVEDEPITTAEIKAIQKQMHLSKKDATDLLIQDRIQESVMKDIRVSEASIDQKVAQIAQRNKLTVPKMQEILKSQGTSWASYRESIRSALKKEQFFRKKAVQTLPTPTEDELKLFYSQHKEEFVLPDTILFVEYMSHSEKAMERFLKTHTLTSSIRQESFREKTKNLSPTLSAVIVPLKEGMFTSLITLGDRYIAYEVTGHEGTMYISYDAVRPTVLKKWQQSQQSQALKDYFEKLKTTANIHIIRK